MSFGFPKAGVLVGDFAVTAQLAVVALGVWAWATARVEGADRRLHMLVAASLWWLVMWAAIGAQTGMTARLVTQFATMLIGPACYFLGLRLHPRAVGALSVTIGAVSLYAIAQWIFGVDTLSVEGLTTSSGENIIADNPLRTASGMIKAPGTYNNGNLLAASLLVAVPVLLLARRPGRRRQRNAIRLAVVALFLTLARSAIVGVGLASIVALTFSRPARAGLRGRRLVSIVVGLGVVTLLASGALGENAISRRLVETLEDPTARGRTNAYAALPAAFSPDSVGDRLGRLLWGVGQGQVDGSAEGIALVFFRGGLITTVLVAAVLWTLLRHAARSVEPGRRDMLVLYAGIGGLIGQSLVDSVLFYPPTSANLGLAVGMIVAHQRARPRPAQQRTYATV